MEMYRGTRHDEGKGNSSIGMIDIGKTQGPIIHIRLTSPCRDAGQCNTRTVRIQAFLVNQGPSYAVHDTRWSAPMGQ